MERPLLMSSPMVKATGEDRKTQTRRVVKSTVKGCTVGAYTIHGVAIDLVNVQEDGDPWTDIKCPYGQVGDRLWVRETWQYHYRGIGYIAYKADDTLWVKSPYGGMNQVPRIPGRFSGWKPSIHMPRWASRITLEITSVQVERLHDINALDCQYEGILPRGIGSIDPCDIASQLREDFRYLWDSINSKRGYGWDVNPFVWCISFKKLD